MGRSKVDEEVRTCGENRIPDCRDSVVLGTETPQGELFFTNAAEQFDAGDGGSCAIKVLEAEHRPCSGFNTPVILFDQIVQVFRRSQLGVLPCLVIFWHLAHCSLRCSVAIQCDTDRRAFLGTKRLAEERLGCRDVSGRAESEVGGVAIPVYGTIQIDPSSSYFQVCLVHTPGAAHLARKASPALLELRRIPLHPSHDRSMRKTQPTFVHHLNQIAKAELVTQVPAYTKDDHIPVEMSPCKQVLHAFHLRPISSKSPMYPTHPLYLHQSRLGFAVVTDPRYWCGTITSPLVQDMIGRRCLDVHRDRAQSP